MHGGRRLCVVGSVWATRRVLGDRIHGGLRQSVPVGGNLARANQFSWWSCGEVPIRRLAAAEGLPLHRYQFQGLAQST